MRKLGLDYIDVQCGRDGRESYFYVRRNGRRSPRLSGDPRKSREANQEYWRYVEAMAPAKPSTGSGYMPGTLGALVTDYFSSAEFAELRNSTAREYRRVLEDMVEKHGHKAVAAIKRADIKRMQRRLIETPGKANTAVSLLRIVLNFAVDEELIKTNPAARIKMLKLGAHRAWSDAERKAFEARWPSGTMQRKAYALALYTGQRKEDVVLMTRAHRSVIDGRPHIHVRQGKGGNVLEIPEHRALTAELALGEHHMSLLTTSRGKAFDKVYFGAWFAEAIDAAGLPNECVLHGLRKSAVVRMLEAGCTHEQVKHVTGHDTTRMVEYYGKGVNQRKMAGEAMRKLENSE